MRSSPRYLRLYIHTYFRNSIYLETYILSWLLGSDKDWSWVWTRCCCEVHVAAYSSFLSLALASIPVFFPPTYPLFFPSLFISFFVSSGSGALPSLSSRSAEQDLSCLCSRSFSRSAEQDLFCLCSRSLSRSAEQDLFYFYPHSLSQVCRTRPLLPLPIHLFTLARSVDSTHCLVHARLSTLAAHLIEQ